MDQGLIRNVFEVLKVHKVFVGQKISIFLVLKYCNLLKEKMLRGTENTLKGLY